MTFLGLPISILLLMAAYSVNCKSQFMVALDKYNSGSSHYYIFIFISFIFKTFDIKDNRTF